MRALELLSASRKGALSVPARYVCPLCGSEYACSRETEIWNVLRHRLDHVSRDCLCPPSISSADQSFAAV